MSYLFEQWISTDMYNPFTHLQHFCLPEPKHWSHAWSSEHPGNNILHRLHTQKILFCNFLIGGSEESFSALIFGYRQWYISSGAISLRHVTCSLNLTLFLGCCGLKCWTILLIWIFLSFDKMLHLERGCLFMNSRIKLMWNSKFSESSCWVISSNLRTCVLVSSCDT